MPSLLAVDLGLRTGLALYSDSGKLLWYRSHNYGTTERLKRGVPALLDGDNAPTAMVIEGGGNLATVWEKEADRRGIVRYRISAKEWRQQFLYSREQRSGPEAKHHAGEIARKIIDWSGTTRPTSLRHDAAEAIMIGLWGVVHRGWLPALPREIHR
jgi:hypothetical protein